jgi:TM2 domain-containing membrane protein YozV
MSDTSQGPGWWQASDAKWYPPSAVPAQPQGPVNRFCTNCAAPVAPGAVACLSCGFQPGGGSNFCGGCGAEVSEGQIVCVKCGQAVGRGASRGGGSGQIGDKSKVVAGLLGIFLGAFGIHKFYLGRTTPALIMLGVTVAGICTGAILLIPIFAAGAMSIIGLIEGILYLTKSDQDFYEEYVVQGKDWF